MPRAYIDRRGHYAGMSEPLGCLLVFWAIVAILALALLLVPFTWPLLVVHGAGGWICEAAWLACLLAGFLLLGRHAARRTAARRAAAPPGPRDWAPPPAV
jgi:hypothetical protein